MRTFIMNILLAFIWVALTGEFTTGAFVSGFLLAMAILWMLRLDDDSRGYFTRGFRAITFTGFFIKELVLANLRLAHDILTPRHRMRPGVIAIPLDLRTDAGITLLSNLLTLTPGTLSLDVSEDRRHLYIHAMYIDDPDTFRQDIKQGFERRVKELVE